MTRSEPVSLMGRIRQLAQEVREHKAAIAWHRDRLRRAAADLEAARHDLATCGLAERNPPQA